MGLDFTFTRLNVAAALCKSPRLGPDQDTDCGITLKSPCRSNRGIRERTVNGARVSTDSYDGRRHEAETKTMSSTTNI